VPVPLPVGLTVVVGVLLALTVVDGVPESEPIEGDRLNDADADGVLEKLGSTAAPPTQSAAFVQGAGCAAPPLQKNASGQETPLLLVLPAGQ
jgi:hypothetical protein